MTQLTNIPRAKLLVEPDGDNCGVTRESWGGYTLHWSDGRPPVELNGDEAVWLARAIMGDHERLASLARQLNASRAA